MAAAKKPPPNLATEPYLADATLQLLGETKLTHLNFLEEGGKVDGGDEGRDHGNREAGGGGGDAGAMKGRTFKAKDLWRGSGALVLAVRRPGWSLCKGEARDVSSIKSELEARGFKLYAVLRESLGYEDFLPYFDGEVFLDTKSTFYGPKFRKRGIFSIFRKDSFTAGWKYKKQGIPLNLKGDGWTLGGIFILGAAEKGILYQYDNQSYGDIADKTAIIPALDKKLEENKS